MRTMLMSGTATSITPSPAKRPTPALGFFRQGGPGGLLAVVELKGPRVHLDRDRSNGRTAVDQVWDYMVNTPPECRWGVVSNIVSFRLYERTSTKREYEHFSLQSLRDYELFKQFYVLFHRQGLVDDWANLFEALDHGTGEAQGHGHFRRRRTRRTLRRHAAIGQAEATRRLLHAGGADRPHRAIHGRRTDCRAVRRRGRRVRHPREGNQARRRRRRSGLLAPLPGNPAGPENRRSGLRQRGLPVPGLRRPGGPLP